MRSSSFKCCFIFDAAFASFSLLNNVALIRPSFPLNILWIFVAAAFAASTCSASKSSLSRANAKVSP
jgi:hypothetical protein